MYIQPFRQKKQAQEAVTEIERVLSSRDSVTVNEIENICMAIRMRHRGWERNDSKPVIYESRTAFLVVMDDPKVIITEKE